MVRNDTDLDEVFDQLDVDLRQVFDGSGHDPAEVVRSVYDQIEEYEDLRPPESEIVEKVSEYFARNVGDVDLDQIIDNVDPNLRVDYVEELLEYHFLRTGVDTDESDRTFFDVPDDSAATETRRGVPIGVRDFVSLLPDRLRTIDTAVNHEVEVLDGEIRGRVDWQRTVKSRYGTSGVSQQQYACRVQNQDVLTLRNRVLLNLLSAITEVCERFEQRHSNDGGFPNWLSEWERGASLRNAVSDALGGAHFNGIREDDISVTDRELKSVLEDRDSLYREAAALLRQYRQIDGDIGDTPEELFGMEVFLPEEDDDGESTIYELYWIFQIVEQFDASGVDPIDLDADGDLVASWLEGTSRYLLFNDWNGTAALDDGESLQYLDFEVPNHEEEIDHDGNTVRAGYTHMYHENIRETAMDKHVRREGDEGPNGTPDIVLLELAADATNPTIRGVFLGEVKYTDSGFTIYEGITQLLDYGAFVRVGDDAAVAREEDSEYVAANPQYLEDDILELGLYVSSEKQLEGRFPEEIQMYGFEQEPDRPLE